MNFVDTGCFINVTKEEKENMIALSTQYTVGKYNPSNKFMRTCRNKNIISIYKAITEAKATKTNILSRRYQYTYDVNKRIHKNKVNNNNNNKTKTTTNKTT